MPSLASRAAWQSAAGPRCHGLVTVASQPGVTESVMGPRAAMRRARLQVGHAGRRYDAGQPAERGSAFGPLHQLLEHLECEPSTAAGHTTHLLFCELRATPWCLPGCEAAEEGTAQHQHHLRRPTVASSRSPAEVRVLPSKPCSESVAQIACRSQGRAGLCSRDDACALVDGAASLLPVVLKQLHLA